jgi:hypothetical protein
MTRVHDLINRFQQNIDTGSVEALKEEYRTYIRPAYKLKYPLGDLPASLFVEEDNTDIDGFGGPGWVQVSVGVARHPLPCFRTFAIVHESGHAVTPLEFARVGAQIWNPTKNDIRFEKIADLIAMKLLMERFPKVAVEVMNNLPRFAQDLGPAGGVRMQIVRQLGSGQPFGQLMGALANRVI